MRPSELFELGKIFIAQRLPLLVTSSPGVGKTSIFEQLAKQMGYDVIVSHPVISEPTDFKGLPIVVDGKAEFSPYGDLRQLMDTTKLTLWIVDDLGHAPLSVQAAIMHPVLARQINGVPISDKVSIVACSNRKSDRAGVAGLLEPLKSRFASIVELEPNVDDWIKWAFDNNMPPSLIGYIKMKPNMLYDYKPSTDMTQSACPRTIAHVGMIQNAGLPEELEGPAFQGAAGAGFSAEYRAYLKQARQLPDIERVLSDPERAPIPTSADLQYTVSAALVFKGNHKNIDAVFTYTKRLMTELHVFTMYSLSRRDPSLVRTQSMKKFFAENKDVVLPGVD